MFRKNLVIWGAICAIAVGASVMLFFMTDKQEEKITPPEKKAEEIKQELPKVEPKRLPVPKEVKTSPKRADLYNETSLPLSAIFEISKLPADVQKIIKNTFDSANNIYMVKNTGKKVFVLSENPDDNRHGLDMTEINLADMSVKKSNLSSQDAGDTEHDKWDYDINSDVKRPVKHAKFDTDGDLEYTEYWNYSDNEPIKYEMKDSNDKVVSIKKETIDNNTDMRLEHLFYDDDGNTKMNISVSYEGPEIKRFTYYNSENPDDSVSVFSEYENGVKIREKVYTSDYKLKNVYAVNYNDNGEKTDITLLDSENNEVDKILSK